MGQTIKIPTYRKRSEKWGTRLLLMADR